MIRAASTAGTSGRSTAPRSRRRPTPFLPGRRATMSEQPVDDPQKLGVAQTWDFWDEARTLILDSPLSEAAKQRLIDGLGPEPPRDGRIALDAEGDHVLAPGAHLVPLLPPDREPELAAD